MPLFDLKFECEEAEGLASVQPAVDNVWLVQFACGRCGEAAPKLSGLDPDSVVEVPGGKGHAHLVQSCKNCGSQFNVAIAADASFKAYEPGSGEASTVLQIECRGCEPTEADLSGIRWQGTAESGSTVDIELEEGEWAGYDDEGDAALSLMGCKCEWERTPASGKH